MVLRLLYDAELLAMILLTLAHCRLHVLPGAGPQKGDFVVATHAIVQELPNMPKFKGFDGDHEVIYAKVVKVSPSMAKPDFKAGEDRQDHEDAMRIVSNAVVKPEIPEGSCPEVAQIVFEASASTLGSLSPLPKPLPKKMPALSHPQHSEKASQPQSPPQAVPRPAQPQ